MAELMKTIAETKFMGNTALISAPSPFPLEDGEYLITIEKKKKGRSLRQNKYFWKLLGEIQKHEDGQIKDVNELYTRLLEMAGAKYESMIIKHEALDRWKQLVRHVKVIKQQTVKNELYDTIYTYYGSSTFSSKEMADLIDVTLRYASEIGVPDVDNYWRELLNDTD